MSIFTDINKVSRAPDNRQVIYIGVFIPTDCQLLDAAGIDIFASLSYEYMAVLEDLVPKPAIDCAPSILIHYIGSVQPGERIPMTANQTVLATNHYDDLEVAPGKLNIVYVPGPDPSGPFPPGALEWLAKQAATDGVDVLSVCTGIFLCGAAGLLKGKDVCGPRAMQDLIRGMGYGEKSLKGDELRWLQDGNFWSSGGVTNANDLVAAYCRASPHYFPRPLVEFIFEQLDVGERPQKYPGEMNLVKYVEEMSALSSGSAAKVAA
ncbi:class I glutamine amidotransferase-like protein [Nemania sp. FL0916]|nr:class I glutamine amidotransferase-like protein [Nemania sp. FL0916]